jgi:molybdopterin/thiamine biosynthesis adenylyltransferase
VSERRVFFREMARAALGATGQGAEGRPEPPPVVPPERYADVVNTEGWSVQAQARLGQASVLVVGAGSLGAPVAMYLTAAGVGRLGVVDPGEVELEALHRQLLHFTPDAGVAKAPAAAVKLGFINPEVQVEPYQAVYQPGMAEGQDLVVDCTGSLAVEGAALAGWATGLTGGVVSGACVTCAFPEGPPVGQPLGPVAGVVGSLMALEALRRLGDISPRLDAERTLIDLDGFVMDREPVRPRPGCPDCRGVR